MSELSAAQLLDDRDANAANDPVARAKSIRSLLRDNAPASERQRTLSAYSVSAIARANLFSLIVPQEAGGADSDLLSLIRVIEEISFADTAAGWSYMVNAITGALAAAFCGDAAVKTLFTEGGTPLIAGMLGPGGSAHPVEGGYRGGGRYSFGSGCAHSTWLTAGLIVPPGPGVPINDAGEPDVLVCFVPSDRVILRDNWHVLGLKGTGSFDYEVPEQFLPLDFSMWRNSISPARGRPHFHFGIAGLGCAGHSAVMLGLMRRALTEIAALSVIKKRPHHPGRISENQIFQREFASNEANYHAARGRLLDVYEAATAAAERGEDLAGHRVRFRQTATWLHGITREVVDFAYRWSGSQGFREPSTIGQCMRDMLVATQHVYVDEVTLIAAGHDLISLWVGDR